jgi:hypothetical protein
MEEDTVTKTLAESKFLSSFYAPIFNEPRNESKPLTRTQKREIILQEIYSYYLADKDNRKRANWKKYREWCIETHRPDTKDNQKAFTRTKLYIKEMNYNSFKWCMRLWPLEDFYVVLSEVKDRSNRGNNVSSFLGGLWFKNV